jgi:hypothetical protein
MTCQRSREQVTPLQAAHAAIARLPLPPHRCQIFARRHVV